MRAANAPEICVPGVGIARLTRLERAAKKRDTLAGSRAGLVFPSNAPSLRCIAHGSPA